MEEAMMFDFMFGCFVTALALFAVLFVRDPAGVIYRLGRIMTMDGRLHMPARKPKESRLLPPLELAALEIECGLEPTWVPMPGGYARNDESLPPEFRPGGVVRKSMAIYDPAKDGPIIPLPPFASLVTPMSAWNPPSAALIPVWSDCDDCETVETQRLCDPVPTKRLSRPCSRHQEAQ